MPHFKKSLYAVHHLTGRHVHVQKGLYSDSKDHFRMEKTGSVPGYEKIKPDRVGPVMDGKWYTNGNCVVKDQKPTGMSGFRECGVQLYYHPIHGQVYLVFNPLYQEALPVPLSATTPSLQSPSAPQPPVPFSATTPQPPSAPQPPSPPAPLATE